MADDRKHILLTTDFSEESFAAFEPVAELARCLDADVTLLYVLPAMDQRPTGLPFVSPVPIPSDEEHLERARQDLAKLSGRLEGLDVHVEARAGEEIGEVVCACAKEIGAGLVALASHGRTGLRRIVLGSVAEEVLHHSDVPVFVVPVRAS